jgi:hypothetical protein
VTPDSLRPWLLLARDALAILVGLCLLIWEAAFRHGQERPTLIVAYFALMGLPFVLRADQKRQDQ